jgi:hypothetical protein
MPSLVFNAPIIAEKAFKQQPVATEIPLAKGGINLLVLPPKPSLIKMPDIKLPQMPLPPTPL